MSNVVVVFYGGRGSGKTLSMTVEGVITMALRGRQVWANYPIAFNFRRDDGSVELLKSNTLEVEDLITFKQEIRDGLILLDELNLWASNRGHASLVNRLLNSWCQLIRKRNLSVYIATQSFNSLDKFFRFQTDLTILCSDLRFRYRGLPEGACIGQRITDWSGMFTGRAIENEGMAAIREARERNTRVRMLMAKRFWGVYDSWSEVDILEAMTQYTVSRDTKMISRDDMGQAYITDGLDKVIADIIRESQRISPGGETFFKEDLHNTLRAKGLTGGDRYISKQLDEAGFVKDGDTYILPHKE